MVEDTRKYILQFNCTDNGQLYEDLLLLTASDVSRLNKALEVLFEAGHIGSADGDRSSASMLQRYREPTFRTFEEMKQSWESAYLNGQLRDAEFDWEDRS